NGRCMATFIREDSVADQIAAGVAANYSGPGPAAPGGGREPNQRRRCIRRSQAGIRTRDRAAGRGAGGSAVVGNPRRAHERRPDLDRVAKAQKLVLTRLPSDVQSAAARVPNGEPAPVWGT